LDMPLVLNPLMNVESSMEDSGANKKYAASIKIQKIFRGALVRHKLNRVPKAEVQKALKQLQTYETGFDRLLAYMGLFALFCITVFIKREPAFRNSFHRGLEGYMSGIKDGSTGYADVTNTDALHGWLTSFLTQTYNGDEFEYRCNACGEIEDMVYPQCAVCFEEGATLTAEQAQACTTCQSTLGYCHDGTCDGFDAQATTGEASFASGITQDYTCGQEKYFTQGITTSWKEYLLTGKTSLSNTAGYVANYNKIIGGLAVMWKARETKPCMNRNLRHSYLECFSKSKITEDLPFYTRHPDTGELTYKHWHTDNEYQFTNIAQSSGKLRFNEDMDSHVVYLDAGLFNMGIYEANCNLRALLDSEYLRKAETVKVLVMVANAQANSLYGLVSATFKFDIGGSVSASVDVDDFQLLSFDSGIPVYAAGFVLEVLFGILLVAIGLAGAKIMATKAKKLANGHGSYRKYLPWWKKMGLTPWGVFYALLFTGFWVNWVHWILLDMKAAAFSPESLEAQGKVNFDEVFDDFEESFVFLQQYAQLVKGHDICFMVQVFFCLGGLLGLMNFHKRLSIITDVLVRALKDLVHFLIVLFMILTVFSTITMLLMPANSTQFVTFGGNVLSMLKIFFGGGGEYFPLFVDANPVVGTILVFVIKILCITFMLKIVIAILMRSYNGYFSAGGGSNAEDIWLSFAIYCCIKRLKLRQFFCSSHGLCSKKVCQAVSTTSDELKGGSGTIRVPTARVLIRRYPAPRFAETHILRNILL